MSKVTGSIEATCSPDEVFAFATDLDRRTQWQLHLSRVERVSDGPVELGTQFRDVSKFGTATLEVTAHDPPNHFAYKNVGGPMEVEVDWRFSPTDTGTHLDVKLNLEPRGFMRILWPVLGRFAIPQAHKDFAELERTVRSL